jgi:septal ring-binding cell division protein DamX
MADTNGKGKGDTLVKLLMVLFVSLLSFSVGTFIGKKTTEKSMERAALEAEADRTPDDREIASIPPGSTDIKPDDALTNEELAQLSDDHKTEGEATAPAAPKKNNEAVGDLVEGKAAVEKPVAKTEAPQNAKENAAKFKNIQQAADRIVKGQDPTPIIEGKAPRTPSSLPAQVASSSIDKYTVQVSSHQTEAEAKKRAQELKSKGFDAFYIRADVKGKPWYRVSVGTFTSSKEARNYVDTLKKEGGVAAAFVQKITQ